MCLPGQGVLKNSMAMLNGGLLRNVIVMVARSKTLSHPMKAFTSSCVIERVGESRSASLLPGTIREAILLL